VTGHQFAARVVARRRIAALQGKRKHRPRTLPRQRQPNAIRLAYWQRLRVMLQYARALVDEELVPQLPALVIAAGVVHDAINLRTYADEVAAILERVAARFFSLFPNEKLRQLALQMGQRTGELQRTELNRQLSAAFGKDIGIDVFAEKGIRERLEAFAAANVQLVKSVPQRFFDEVGSRVVQGLRTGERAAALQADIKQRYGVSESRAKLIARDQVGKLYGELNMARQQDLGISSFTWRTSEDERVRPEHEELDGESFPWDAPPSEGVPGEPINCRCTGEPNIQEIIDAL
jgi:SPP1 gp7 family putative phage head morphogenesis protein